MSARISVPPDIEEAFGEAVHAAIKDLKRQGYSKAYICERSFEIEDAALEQVLKGASPRQRTREDASRGPASDVKTQNSNLRGI